MKASHEGESFDLLTPLPYPPLNQQRTMRLAWMILLLTVGIFCLLLIGLLYMTWHYRTHATDVQSSTLIVRAPAEWVTWKRKNRTTFERVQDGQALNEGDQLRIASSAGYGQAATIRLADNSTLDVWAGTDLLLEQMRTRRWNDDEQTFVFLQNSGYIRYDLRDGQPYQQVNFLVRVGDTQIWLAPGGSYSIEVRPPDRQVLFSDPVTHKPVLIDVAARAGHAEVQSQNHTVAITAGQRTEIDAGGMPSAPMPARWELIEDGDFSRYTESEYNNTTVIDQPMLRRSDTWQVYGVSTNTLARDDSGFFKLSYGCEPPDTSSCDPQDKTHIAWFWRTGDQTKNFTTGVMQMLGKDDQGIDISEYRSLMFSLWVQVLSQSIALTGDEGTECPVMVRFIFKQQGPMDAEQARWICFYASDDPATEPERSPGITYYRVPSGEWYHLKLDLRADHWLPDARYLQSIAIYANGHDYNSRVATVSLVGSHYAPDTRNTIAPQQ